MTAPRAMVLAAGRGSRLRPLTDALPKPLVTVGEVTLIDARLRALADAGVQDVVVNTAWLGDQIRAHLGDTAHGLNILWSDEGDQALETGGGIAKALPLLGEAPFIVCNADVWTNHPIAPLVAMARDWPAGRLAHLVLVDNPAWRPSGELALAADHTVRRVDDGPCTLAGIEVLHPALFSEAPAGAFALPHVLWPAVDAGRVSGERIAGYWSDIGTPERLAEARLDKRLGADP